MAIRLPPKSNLSPVRDRWFKEEALSRLDERCWDFVEKIERVINVRDDTEEVVLTLVTGEKWRGTLDDMNKYEGLDAMIVLKCADYVEQDEFINLEDAAWPRRRKVR